MIIYTFELGNLSSWLSAIGSVGALMFAIYIANKGNKVKLDIMIINDKARNHLNGDDIHKRELCITNIGVRTAHIKSIASCERRYLKYRVVSEATNSEQPIFKSLSQGEMFVYNFSLWGLKLDEDKHYYMCVKELSGKKHYVKLTP